MNKSMFEERKNCPACGSNNIKERYKALYSDHFIKKYLTEFYSLQGGVEFDYLINEEYILCDCKICGMIFQKKIPNQILMEKLYEHWIDPIKAFENHKLKMNQYVYDNYTHEIKNIGSYIKKPHSNINLLDFGMGWGAWLSTANKLGFQSYGIELSESRIAYARKIGVEVIDWKQAENIKFDFINTEQVFEHIPNPLETLKKLKLLLKSSGLIKISVPTANDIEHRLNLMDWNARKYSPTSLNAVAPLEHIQYFKRSSLINMSKIAGMYEVNIPLLTQWKNSIGWLKPKRIIRNAILPIYRNFIKKQNYIFLTSV